MNTLAILPDISRHLLQGQNIKRDMVKKFEIEVASEVRDTDNFEKPEDIVPTNEEVAASEPSSTVIDALPKGKSDET